MGIMGIFPSMGNAGFISSTTVGVYGSVGGVIGLYKDALSVRALKHTDPYHNPC